MKDLAPDIASALAHALWDATVARLKREGRETTEWYQADELSRIHATVDMWTAIRALVLP